MVGYAPYLARLPASAAQQLHPSDNRAEMARAHHALEMTMAGRHVAVVSSGDPGVFAMGAAVMEALENSPPAWRDMEIRILPGITAMLAAAAAVGAPLGHDFCAINLSDNLKPWEVIETRLKLALEADFAMALYNPRSKARPEGFAKALALLQAAAGDRRPMIFARNVSLPTQTITIVPLDQARPHMADMRTIVLLGSSQTRVISRKGGALLYTPRSLKRA